MPPNRESDKTTGRRTHRGTSVFLGLAGWLALLCGCATPTLEQRRTERAEAYAALTAEARALVDRGEIAEGMGTNAVFIAWGRPTKAIAREAEGGSEIEWRYDRTCPKPRRVLYTAYDGRGYPRLDSYYDATAWRYLARRVVFRDGRVAWFRTHSPPVP